MEAYIKRTTQDEAMMNGSGKFDCSFSEGAFAYAYLFIGRGCLLDEFFMVP